ncbi:MAG TPA: DUF1972 domain-containing protein [Acidimicrobiales bacterium]|nr:DUF1972 domain-containing protein [Acidimicrobiales bacterium]
MRIALVGTRGVPARYGGFETAAEEIGRRLVERGHEVVVYCRNADPEQVEYLGMELVHLRSLRLKFSETLTHTAMSLMHLRSRPVDVAVVFNAANAPLLPIVRRRGIPVAVHVDGLESLRAKWGGIGRAYYKKAEKVAVRWADELIADARGIQEHYALTYGVSSRLIAYGAPLLYDRPDHRLEELGLRSARYHLVVARFEPENCIDVIVDGYQQSEAELPLIVVGSAPYGNRYRQRVESRAANDERVRLLGPVWDQELLDQLYAHASSYVHGHSVGGTNPSLLRAMGAGAPVIAIDVRFTREVLEDTGVFFRGPSDLAGLISGAEADPKAARERGRRGRERAASAYVWEDVVDDYERMCQRLHEDAQS